jgi:hypothetical protein
MHNSHCRQRVRRAEKDGWTEIYTANHKDSGDDNEEVSGKCHQCDSFKNQMQYVVAPSLLPRTGVT